MAVAMGAYVVAYVLASPALGSQTSILVVLPVVLGGWLLGSRGGLLVGLLAIALNTVLVSVIRDASLQEWARAGGLLGSAALLLVGGVTGWLRDLKAEAARAVIRQEAAQGQIIQQERLRALGEMAAGIAHDVNNNLTGVLGFSEMLLNHRENLDNKEAVTHALRAINTAAKDAAEVVRRLAEFYRPLKDSETFALIDLGHLVEQVVTFTRPKWQQQAQSRGVDVRVETDLSEVPLVAGNESELREVLTNLIFNAVDAMQISGGITVRAQPEGEDVVLSVEDTGTGMTEEVRRRSMEPFFSTKGVAGSGLGLSLAYGVIQRHRGTIEIESEIGSGTTVVVRLPVQAGQQRAAVGGEAIAKTAALRVLAVDDQPMPLEVVARYLAADGHFVETATNGQEALKKFQASEFDVVITDRAMPIINGDQLTALIKETAPEVPVILLTGFGDMILANEESVGDVAVVVGKPVTVAALRDALAKAIA
jgi:signal transduction histidine kinase